MLWMFALGLNWDVVHLHEFSPGLGDINRIFVLGHFYFVLLLIFKKSKYIRHLLLDNFFNF